LWVIKKIYKKNSEFKKLFDQIDFVSLWKWQARKKSNIGKKNISEKLYYFDEKFNIKSQNLKYDQIDKILLTARDEAHRFANVYRKKQMSKERK
jgi:excinuclease UvrABC nuclease subunit